MFKLFKTQDKDYLKSYLIYINFLFIFLEICSTKIVLFYFINKLHFFNFIISLLFDLSIISLLFCISFLIYYIFYKKIKNIYTTYIILTILFLLFILPLLINFFLFISVRRSLTSELIILASSLSDSIFFITQELKVSHIFYILISLLIFISIFNLLKRFIDLINNKLFIIKFIYLYFIIFAFFIISFTALNYYALKNEKNTLNPYFELTKFYLGSNKLLVKLIKNQNTQQKTKLGKIEKFHTRSFINKNKFIIPKNIKIKKNFNIVIYLFESTCTKFLDYTYNNINFTPNINKLSNNSLYFKNHYCQFPLSVKSIFTLLTGLYPYPNEESECKKYSNIKIKTLPEILKENGYKTAIYHSYKLEYTNIIDFIKKRGFDDLKDMDDLLKEENGKKFEWGLDDRCLIQASKDFILKNKDNPFFVIISPLNPHRPYYVIDKKFKILKGESEQERYYNSLYSADFILGETYKMIEETGCADNTLFIIIADHGEGINIHPGNVSHPFYIYEENVLVPFIIINRKIFNRKIIFNDISRHVDLTPTILDLLGLKIPDYMQGISLVSPHYSQLALFYTFSGNRLIGIKDDNLKIIINLDNNSEEVFDLIKDPDELKNLFNLYKDSDNIKFYEKILKYFKNFQTNYLDNLNY